MHRELSLHASQAGVQQQQQQQLGRRPFFPPPVVASCTHATPAPAAGPSGKNAAFRKGVCCVQIDAALVGAKLLIPTTTMLSRDAAAPLARVHPASERAAAPPPTSLFTTFQALFNVLLFTFFFFLPVFSDGPAENTGCTRQPRRLLQDGCASRALANTHPLFSHQTVKC